jgi:adenylate cyclase
VDAFEQTIESILADSWTPRRGVAVPQVDAVNLSNDIVQIDGAVLFADLAHSTVLVRDHVPQFAAQVIKVFLAVCSRAIRRYDGDIRSFDGDRVMGVFTGNNYIENATRAALLINGLMINSAIPKLMRRWNFNTLYRIAYGCGVDFGQIHVIKAGIRSYNDLVFLGMPTINAAKLAQERHLGLPVLITKNIFSQIQGTALWRTDSGQPAWRPSYSAKVKGLIYGSPFGLNS